MDWIMGLSFFTFFASIYGIVVENPQIKTFPIVLAFISVAVYIFGIIKLNGESESTLTAHCDELFQKIEELEERISELEEAKEGTEEDDDFEEA
jgi:hypothetical protein